MQNNPESYVLHQLNNSKSKHSYKFAKSQRFKIKKMSTPLCYDKPTTLSKRTCNFGYGDKVKMNTNKVCPPPGNYRSVSDFDPNNNKKVSFGYGRQDVSFGYFMDQIKRKQIIPSPDKYTTTITKNQKGGVMGKKLLGELQMIKNDTSPGPGTYKMNAVQINCQKGYVLSNYINKKSPRYFKQSNRRHSTCCDTVSPASYNPYSNEMGKYFVSKFKNIKGQTFSKSIRQGIIDKFKVYPSKYYRRFSEFGLHT